MSWLGSTLKTLDTRKELVNYIGGNTIPSRAVVTNNGGEIDSSVVTLAELALLSGVSSNVQTQLTGLGDDKQDEITGAATTVTSANLTSDRVLLSDASGKISASNVTATTLAYLDPTSSIQGQINSKQSEITTSAPLSQSKVDGLANTLSGKQPTIGSSTDLNVNKLTFGTGVDAIDFQGVVPTNSTLVLSSGTLTLTDSASGTVAADLSGINTDTNTTNSTLVLSSGTLTLTDSASGTVAADLSGINTDTNTTNSTLVLSNDTLTLTDSAGGTVAADVSGITIPQADGDTIGGVRVNGNNLSINSATGILSATINVRQSVVHVGVFTLQATTNLSSATETLLRWKPGLSATDSSSQGLVHTATNNIPQGTLFTCSDTSGVYNINVQLALTDGTTQGRSFHVAELRVYTNATSTTGYGDDVRTYFLGSGYSRMLSGTNKCFWGGSIQITMQQNDQFEILTSRKYVSNTNALNLNDGALATRLIIDRVIIS
jgi:hypothetical protein